MRKKIFNKALLFGLLCSFALFGFLYHCADCSFGMEPLREEASMSGSPHRVPVQEKAFHGASGSGVEELVLLAGTEEHREGENIVLLTFLLLLCAVLRVFYRTNSRDFRPGTGAHIISRRRIIGYMQRSDGKKRIFALS